MLQRANSCCCVHLYALVRVTQHPNIQFGTIKETHLYGKSTYQGGKSFDKTPFYKLAKQVRALS
jgi:hypothetical protein